MSRPKKRNQATEHLLAALQELKGIAREGLTLEQMKHRFPTRIIAPEPRKHTPATVRAIRTKIGVSQSDFADLVGVSCILVKSWERGVRQPSPLARRLLDTISADPAAWLAGLVAGAKNSRRAG